MASKQSKRKSELGAATTPKKLKGADENVITPLKTPKSAKKNAANKSPNGVGKKTPNATPKSPGKNGNQAKGQNNKNKKQKQKPVKQPAAMDVDSDEDEEASDYEVETTVIPQKVTKKLNAAATDSDNDDDSAAEEEGSDEEAADDSDEEAADSDEEAADSDEEDDDAAADSDEDTEKPAKPKPAAFKKKTTVFVGNLAFTASKEEVEEFFSQVAEVEAVRLLCRSDGRSRGCAFVDLAKEADQKKALALNQTKLGGRTVNVSVANNSKPSPKGGKPGGFGGAKGGFKPGMNKKKFNNNKQNAGKKFVKKAKTE